MRILAIISGEYGRRHVENIQKHGPENWSIEIWEAPAVLPPVIDYPEDYLPESFPASELILSFAEHKGVAELLPDIAEMSSLSKAKTGDFLHVMSNQLIQIHGGIGMTDEFDAGFYLKRARVLEHLFGNQSYHRERYATLLGF